MHNIYSSLGKRENNIEKAICLSPAMKEYFSLVIDISLPNLSDDQIITYIKNSKVLFLQNSQKPTEYGKN